MCSPCR